jgi:DNA polymerase III sliding clamp (beta) subunit (PCNA family)
MSVTSRRASVLLERGIEPGILPLREARVLARALARIAEPNADVVISRHARFMQFGIGMKHTFGVRMLEETYLEYQKFIPRHPQSRAIMRTGTMRKVMRAITAAMPPGDHTVVVRILADSVTVGPATSTESHRIDARVTGTETTVGFRADRLSEIIAHMDADEMGLGIACQSLPASITDAVHGITTFVLMPQRV